MPTYTNYENNKTNFADFIPANQVAIKAKMSEVSVKKFNENIKKLQLVISPETKYIITKIYLQLGEPEEQSRTFDYLDKNNIEVFVQPKIKNYIEFKTKESAERYRDEELSENDICLFLEVGKFGIGLK